MSLQSTIRERLIGYMKDVQEKILSVENERVYASLESPIALAALFLILTPAMVASAATVTLWPGADIQAAINSYPPGSTFSLNAGTYRGQSLIPLNGDKFIGQTGADLNGSVVVRNWVHTGSYWVSPGNPELNTPIGPP